MSYIILPEARSDIDQILNYISRDGTTNAFNWLKKLYTTFELLADFPLMGYLREDLDSDMRFWPFGRYLILYHISKPIHIVGVFSSYRNLNLSLRF